jgi:hypothetical protein
VIILSAEDIFVPSYDDHLPSVHCRLEIWGINLKKRRRFKTDETIKLEAGKQS